MNLNEEQIITLIKYLPEDAIDNILNFQRIIDYVCNRHKITEEQLSAKSKKGVLPHARMILIGLTISIFDPNVFEEYVNNKCPIKFRKTKIKTGLGKMIMEAIDVDHAAPTFYLNRFRNYKDTNQIDFDAFKKMEIEVINQFEYLN